MSEWQPIETAPKDGTALMLYVPGDNSWNRLSGMPDMVIGMWDAGCDGSGSWQSDCGYADGCESTGGYFVRDEHFPTHWAPLLAPPTEKPSIMGRE